MNDSEVPEAAPGNKKLGTIFGQTRLLSAHRDHLTNFDSKTCPDIHYE